jgi:hypothetical protein
MANAFEQFSEQSPAKNAFDQFTIQKEQAAATQVLAGDVDKKTGAPLDVRTAVGAAKTPKDRLSTLQKFYPDARILDDNFVYTDPQTNQQKIFNPEGMDLGDVGENLRMGFEGLGGTIGGTLGVPGGPPGSIALGAAGTVLGGKVYDWLSSSLLPVDDTRTAVEAVGSDALEFGANILGGKAGQELGILAGNIGTKISQATRKPISETFEAGVRVGADLPPSAVTGSKTLSQVESGLSQLPIASDIIGTKFAKTLDALSAFSKKTSERLSSKSGETSIGTSIIKGVNDFTVRFSKQGGELYDNMWAKMPKSARVSVDNFSSKLDEITNQFKDDPALSEILTPKSLEAIKKAIDEAGPEGVTINTLKALRSKIGKELDTKSLLPDANQAELKSLYGALSEDMKVAAGDFGATKEFNRANGFWSAGRARIDEVLQPIVKNGMAEQVYRRMFGAEGKALRNIPASEVNALMKSLPVGSRQDVQAEIVRRMGMSTSGAQDLAGEAFSPSVFMTNWNRLGDKTRNALFHGDTELVKAMDDLALVSQSIKQGSKTANTSNTAGSNIMIGLLTGTLGVQGGTTGAAVAGAVLAPMAAAKLMTNKHFVKWLAKSGGSNTTEKAIGENLARLGVIAKANPAIREEVHQFLAALETLQDTNQDNTQESK